MMNYNSQAPAERKGNHTASMVEGLFCGFVAELQGLDFDLMLEIKNKKASVLRTVAILHELVPALGLDHGPRCSREGPRQKNY